MDASGFHAGCLELIAIGAGEVQVKTSAGTDAEPPLDGRFAMPGGSERLNHLVADFAAADVQAGADRGDEIPRARAELASHRLHTRLNRPLNRAPPAGMNRSDHRPGLVGQQNRGAIGHPHANHHLRVVSHDGVAFRRGPAVAITATGNRDLRLVHLLYQPDPGDRDAKRVPERLPLPVVSAQAEVMGGEEVPGVVRQRDTLSTEPTPGPGCVHRNATVG